MGNAFSVLTMHDHMNRQEHWNQVYQTKATDDVSWYQRRPDASLALIAVSGISKDAGVIDVGGGASLFIDFPARRRLYQ
ncbi:MULTISPECIES: hypothetical protein [Roseiflexus]|jgi:hypothetical protein|uniref:hypothetical protein n=1 Tax=Roseiflexus TaxID=120961 RepID=UPI0002DBDA70|nr:MULTISPECIES: hypothetical protein [Roseiflexus]GIV98835.1 MAG: hypothetical protein KatS3mg058_0239 [Roseiflexus sp.]